ncbi:MAG: hypothetical protein RLY47_420 [Candidatus Parcubacteria bacterium]|jgi:glycosyltransferase involved in cell wall biosynthesis
MISFYMKLLVLTQKVDETDDNLGFFHQWITEFAAQSSAVVVICLYEGKHHLPPNVRVISLGKEGGVSRFKYLWRFYSQIWRERNNYDAVFVHMNQIYVILGRLIWWLIGVPVGLWYAHGSTPISLRIATGLSDILFTATAGSFRIPSRKVHVIGHGIDTERFAYVERVPNPPIKLITVGRISPIKDYETIIEAVRLLREKGVPCHLEIVGSIDGVDQREYLSRLQEQIDRSGCKEEVRFLGAVSQLNLVPVLSRADLFVQASRTGSLDKAPLEAMATGIPACSCNESVISIMPNNARDRFAFRPGEAGELANRIEDFSRCDHNERSRVGKEARHIVTEQHRLQNCVGAIIDGLLGLKNDKIA